LGEIKLCLCVGGQKRECTKIKKKFKFATYYYYQYKIHQEKNQVD